MALGGDLYRLSGKNSKAKKETKQQAATKKLVKQRQETRAANAKKGTSVVRRTTNQAIEYNQKGYTGKSGDKKTTSYEWESDLLFDMPRSMGRSYNDKFDSWTKSLGFSKQEANEFRTWLDSKEDVIKTRKRSNQEGYKEIPIKSQNSLLEEMLDSKTKQGNERTKRINVARIENDKQEAKDKAAKSKKQSEERDGFLGVLDKTVGRASRSMSEFLLGEDFVNKQDEVYKRNAEARGDNESLKRTNVVSREAQSGLEKAGDIAGTVAGVGAYILPGAASYKAVNTVGNLAKLTKGGSQAAAALSKAPYAAELVRGASAGAVFGMGNQAAREMINPDEFNGADHWKRIAFDVVAGGVGDVAVRGIGQGFNALKNIRADKANVASGAYANVDLPSFTGQPSKEALDSLSQGQSSLVNSQSRNIVNSSVNRSSQSQLDNVLAEMKAARQVGSSSPMPTKNFEKQLDTAIAKSREEAIQAQYEYLKSYKGKGKIQGGLGRNEMGEVTTAIPPISNNAGWYRNLDSKSQKSLKELAIKHVDEGFVDEFGNIPAWRPSQLDDLEQQIAQYTKIIANDPEQTPAILPLLEAAEADYTALLASYNKVKPQSAPQIIDTPIQQISTNQEILPIQQTFDNAMNDIGSLRSSIDNQRQNIENLRQPSQNASEGVLRASDTPEGILSQSVPNTQNTANITQLEGNAQSARNLFENIEAAPTGGKLLRADSNTPPLVPQPVNADIPYKSGDVLPDTSRQIGSKTDIEGTSLRNKFDNLVVQTVDNLDPIKKFSQMKEKAMGKSLPASKDAYKLGLNSRGSDQTSYQIMNNDLVDMQGNVVGDSLKSITGKMNKKKLKQFEDYLINKHAITRQEKGQRVFASDMQMNAKKSAAIVKKYETSNPEFVELSERLYDFQRKRNEAWLLESGLLTKKQLEAYTKDSPNYIPNMRIFNNAEKKGLGRASKGFNNQNSQIKKVSKTGSERKIVSPIESIIEQTDNIVKAARRNETMRVMIEQINDDPELYKGLIEIVPTTKKANQALKSFDDEGVDGLIAELNESFVKQTPDLTKGNIVFGVVNGEKVHLKVHEPLLLDAITNLTPQAQGKVIKYAGEITRVMKTLTTGINPVFSFTRNIWRDIPDAYKNSKTVNNPAKFAKDYASAVVSVLKNDDSFKMYKRMGGGHASSVSQDVNLLAQSKRNVMKDNSLKSLGGKLLGGFENLNNLAEAPPRLAEFKRLIKQDSSYDGKVSALFESNDITTNFKKWGNTTKELDAFFPYLNAAAQGLNKTWRVVKDNPIQSTIKGFMAVTVPSMVMYAVNHDDEDYHELSDFVKDNNYLIPKGDGTFYKIPKPRENGVIFGSSVERALTAWSKEDPEAFEGWKDTILTNFLPPIVPGVNARTIFAPINDVRANKNFMDAPIVSASLEGLPKELQYDSKTSEGAKLLGNLTKQSPKEIDYLFKSYSGIVGELGIPLTTKGGSVGDTLVQKVSADPVFSNDHATKFYKMKKKVDEAYAANSRKGIETDDLNEDLRKEMNNRIKEIGKINERVKAIQDDDSLTNKEKREKTRRWQKEINELYNTEDLTANY